MQAHPRGPEARPGPSPAAQGLTLSRELSDTVHELLQGRRHIFPQAARAAEAARAGKAAALGGGAAAIHQRPQELLDVISAGAK